MDFLAWLVLFGLTAVPVGGLLLDRILDVPVRRYFAVLGPLAIVAFLAWLVLFLPDRGHLLRLALVGALGGAVGSVALDAVRLIGVAGGAFPTDMPTMFGLILLGLPGRLQQHMMAQMVRATSELPAQERRRVMARRLEAVARLPEARRLMVIGGMARGLGGLPERQRQEMMTLQMELVSELDGERRRAIMAAMDLALSGRLDGVLRYGQPRGMPRIPMATFRSFFSRALPETLRDARVGLGTVLVAGYVWHFVMGATFGAQYALLVGGGTWALALAWGVFVWLAMMVLMPLMMPLVGFPRWFPIVPFIAHIAWAIPLGYVTLWRLGPGFAPGSLAGLLGFGG